MDTLNLAAPTQKSNLFVVETNSGKKEQELCLNDKLFYGDPSDRFKIAKMLGLSDESDFFNVFAADTGKLVATSEV